MFKYRYRLKRISLLNIRVDATNDRFYSSRCVRYLVVGCWIGSRAKLDCIVRLRLIIQMAEQQVQKAKKVKTVGDYQLGRTIGKGTFAHVREGIHTKTGEKVSIKVLHKNLIMQARDKINLSRELRILKRVRHPNIAQLLQTFETNSKIYIVMEYVENGQLFNLITQSKKGRLTQAMASVVFQQLINAIEYLHSIGVAHRDIKPENILLDYQNNVKLIDFGLSNFYQKNEKLLTSCGSPCYAAPEMLVEQAYDPMLADIWSCGIVLYAMVCGFLPFEDKSTKVLYHKIKDGYYEQPKHMSIVAKSLITKILKFEPEARLSFAEIRDHSFCSPSQPIARGLLPSESLKLDDKIVEQMIRLKYGSFKADVENHRNSSSTAAYFLLLYKNLRENNESLISYFASQFMQEQIKSSYRSKSLMLKRSVLDTSPNINPSEDVAVKKSTVNNEEEEFLDKLYQRNASQFKHRKSIRVRKITGI